MEERAPKSPIRLETPEEEAARLGKPSVSPVANGQEVESKGQGVAREESLQREAVLKSFEPEILRESAMVNNGTWDSNNSHFLAFFNGHDHVTQSVAMDIFFKLEQVAIKLAKQKLEREEQKTLEALETQAQKEFALAREGKWKRKDSQLAKFQFPAPLNKPDGTPDKIVATGRRIFNEIETVAMESLSKK